MTRPGRALRDHWMVMSDSPEQIADRIRRRSIGDRAHREMLAKFGELTAENAASAIQWQESRIKELSSENAP